MSTVKCPACQLVFSHIEIDGEALVRGQAIRRLEIAIRKARRQGLLFWTCRPEYETVLEIDAALAELNPDELFCSMCGLKGHKTEEHKEVPNASR